MKKALLTAVGLGAAYLYKNPQVRQKLMSKVQSFMSQSKSTSPATPTK
ncbi:hypothetical protein [Paenibacillus agricola]|uniref:YtxH-like protein n=1 Tax=Paenibacillus agricola TaxID=2716264 RepID=A0ABX0JFB4_9BACL|nr:hypothetical protein [Paenibacillus agricola]NHN34598.1 hypothetical protein [Paenibacillus agricola]